MKSLKWEDNPPARKGLTLINALIFLSLAAKEVPQGRGRVRTCEMSAPCQQGTGREVLHGADLHILQIPVVSLAGLFPLCE